MIKWCLKKKHGITLAEPNEELAKAYVLKAQRALSTMDEVSAPEWKITAAYYAMYFSVYAIMIRIGVKCEIHECTLAFMKEYLPYTPEENSWIVHMRDLREKYQYYIAHEIDSSVLGRASIFIKRSKKVMRDINPNRILEIRNALQTALHRKE